MIRVSTFASEFRCTKSDGDDYPYTLSAEEADYGGGITLYLSEEGLARLRETIANPTTDALERSDPLDFVLEHNKRKTAALEPVAGTPREITLTADENDIPF